MTEKPKSSGTVDVGGLWSDPNTGAEKDALQAARIVVDLPKKRMVMATAAPGMN